MDWIIENPQILVALKFIAKLGVAFILGCIGGITLGLIQFKGGLEIPDCYQKLEPVNGKVVKSYFDLGFFAELLVGGVAAVVIFCLQPSGGVLHLIAYSLIAGIGGGSLLLSFTNALRFKGALNELNTLSSTAEGIGDVANTALRTFKLLSDTIKTRDPQAEALAKQIENTVDDTITIINERLRGIKSYNKTC